MPLTIHQLLFLHGNREACTITFKMERKYVEACTALMAFYGQGTRFVLHGKVISDGARTIANEIECGGKAFHWEERMKEVIEGALSRADPSGWGGTDSVKSANEP